jgi:hypothetical protein
MKTLIATFVACVLGSSAVAADMAAVQDCVQSLRMEKGWIGDEFLGEARGDRGER